MTGENSTRSYTPTDLRPAGPGLTHGPPNPYSHHASGISPSRSTPFSVTRESVRANRHGSEAASTRGTASGRADVTYAGLSLVSLPSGSAIFAYPARGLFVGGCAERPGVDDPKPLEGFVVLFESLRIEGGSNLVAPTWEGGVVPWAFEMTPTGRFESALAHLGPGVVSIRGLLHQRSRTFAQKGGGEESQISPHGAPNGYLLLDAAFTRTAS